MALPRQGFLEKTAKRRGPNNVCDRACSRTQQCHLTRRSDGGRRRGSGWPAVRRPSMPCFRACRHILPLFAKCGKELWRDEKVRGTKSCCVWLRCVVDRRFREARLVAVASPGERGWVAQQARSKDGSTEHPSLHSVSPRYVANMGGCVNVQDIRHQ